MILYVCHQINDRVNNFINNCIFKDDAFDFIFIINDKNLNINHLNLPSYVKIIQRDNIGFDFGGWSEGLLNNDLYKNYDSFIFINSSVYGPCMEKNDNRKWTDILLNGLNYKNIKLFGTTINCINDAQKSSHVQSMVFCMDLITLKYLISKDIFSIINFDKTFNDTIMNKEIRMSREIINNGWNIGCLHTYYKDIDFTFKNNNREIIYLNDLCFKNVFFGKTIHPYEILFVKGNRNIEYDFIKQYIIMYYNNINYDFKIIIYSFAFNINSGGITALYNLARLLNIYIKDNKFNICVKIFDAHKKNINNTFYNNFALNNEVDNNTIVIYPEIISGNPLNAKYVVRWILAELGINTNSNIYKSWNTNDLVYHWEPISKLNYKILNCPFIHPIFSKINFEKRENTCYLIRKGISVHKTINYFHPQNSICVDDKSLEEINKIFNSCKYFYCYDPFTFYISYAIICGCIPILYPIENKTKEDYINNIILKNIKYAIAYGNTENEIKYAESILEESASELINIENNNLKNIELFLNDIIPYVKNNKNNIEGTVFDNYYE